MNDKPHHVDLAQFLFRAVLTDQSGFKAGGETAGGKEVERIEPERAHGFGNDAGGTAEVEFDVVLLIVEEDELTDLQARRGF
jgi:uncharacterized spore protein YtfJ